jgi:hypothetical protein
MDSQESRKEWLDPLLTGHLNRVAAPEELWDRVRNSSATPLRRSRAGLAWAVAVAMAVVMVAWGLYSRRESAVSNEARAAQALTRGVDHLEFRSEEATQIRAWVKGRTGLDIPLRVKPASSIRMVGARIGAGPAGSGPTAEVVYRVGDGIAVLLVSQAESPLPGNPTHRFLSSGVYRGARVSSWLMHGQMCTLACAIPENAHAACLLCHVEPSRGSALN